jgi:alpha-1,3-rhamnosyl/mannosyltransferase
MSNMLKVFVDASPLAERGTTGIPHFTAELVRALLAHPDHGNKFKVILVISFDKKAALRRWGYQGVGYRVLPLPMRIFNLVWKLNLLPPLDLLLGKGVYLFPNYRNWPLLKRSKSITYIHDLTYVRYPEFVQPNNLAFLQSHVDGWIRRSDVIVTGSRHAKQEITELLHVDPARITVIYHGVDDSVYYRRPEAEIRAACEKYGLTMPYILHLGTLEPRKNIVNLVRAYRQLPDDLRAHYGLLLVGGRGWRDEEITREVQRAVDEGYAVMRPNAYVTDDDLPAVISGAALLVHPAVYEGFGLSPLQAMACGTPVVVADNSSLPEVVGDAGLYVKADSAEDISDKMREMLQNAGVRDRLVTAGLTQAKKFSWKAAGDSLVTTMYKAVGNA